VSSDASREEHEESAKAILAGSFLGTVKGRTIMSKETVPMFSGKGLGNQTITLEGGHKGSGEAGSEAAPSEVGNPFTADEGARALTSNLMERVCEPSNLRRACQRVKGNKGAPGVDGLSVEAAFEWLRLNKDSFTQSLLDGSYRPSPVRGVDIPKPNGGTRELGIPTVVDRIVQQAILQVLEPIFEPSFSPHSYGFRPGRSAHDAVKQARNYVEEGKEFVVDMDLEKFFDRVNHDILMSRLARRITDKRLLRIVRRFLQAGMMKAGVVTERTKGTPQGGPLSPLLSNILLTDLDEELSRRGHSFCRYADDCNVYVASQAAAERVLASMTRWLSDHLHLQVNSSKSAAAPISERKFLGFRLTPGGRIQIAPESRDRLRRKLRDLTKRRTPRSIEATAGALTPVLRGWGNYYRIAECRSFFLEIDGWIRRRLRAIRLRQCKRMGTRAQFLIARGVPAASAWQLASSGKGMWRLSLSRPSHTAMNKQWFKELGLFSLASMV
jgi:RNA-directed DNA polymerase